MRVPRCAAPANPPQNSADALRLVGAPEEAAAASGDDRDFARATEFLALRAEQVRPDELNEKRRAVAKVLARVVDGVEEDAEGVVRMAGSWDQ